MRGCQIGASRPRAVPDDCATHRSSARENEARYKRCLEPGFPFDVAVAPPGQYALAAVQASFGRRRSPSELAVLRLGSRSRAPQLVRTLRLPRSLSPMGLAISRNGKYLAVAASVATAVLSLPALLAGRPDALLGILRDGESGVIEVTLSATGKFLFVSDEGSSVISVFNLARALLGGFSAPGVAVGRVTLGLRWWAPRCHRTGGCCTSPARSAGTTSTRGCCR